MLKTIITPNDLVGHNFTFECSRCGHPLGAEISDVVGGLILISLCPDCEDRIRESEGEIAFSEGYDEGYSNGHDAGYEHARDVYDVQSEGHK